IAPSPVWSSPVWSSPVRKLTPHMALLGMFASHSRLRLPYYAPPIHPDCVVVGARSSARCRSDSSSAVDLAVWSPYGFIDTFADCITIHLTACRKVPIVYVALASLRIVTLVLTVAALCLESVALGCPLPEAVSGASSG